jgi:hypothetical protein
VSTVGEVLDAINARDQRQALGSGALQLRDSEGELNSYGLQNLAQMVASEPTAEWPQLVADHFENMLTVVRPPQSAEDALPTLRVRLWPADYVQSAHEAIFKQLAPELVLALVIDLPKSVMSATRGHLAAWGFSEDMAWSAAEANSKMESYEVLRQATLDGSELLFLIGENLYVTSNVLWLNERIDLIDENGALVGIPTRHLLVVLPIRDIGAVKALAGMLSSNRAIYEDGPGSISPELFWWRRGRLTLLPTDASVQPAQFRPPADFVDMLNRLAAGGAGSG